MPKNVKGDPLGFLNIHSIAKFKKNEGGPFEDIKNFSGKSREKGESLMVPKKRGKGTFMLLSGFVFHVRDFGCVQNQVLSTVKVHSAQKVSRSR